MVADSRKVLDSASANEHNRVLLEVMADPRYVGRNFHTVGKSDSGNLSQGRVRLLRCFSTHDQADSTLLRIAPQSRSRGSLLNPLTTFSDKLANSRQADTPLHNHIAGNKKAPVDTSEGH